MDEQKANFQYLGKVDRQNWSRYFTLALHTLILSYSKHVMDLRRRIPANVFEKSECPVFSMRINNAVDNKYDKPG